MQCVLKPKLDIVEKVYTARHLLALTLAVAASAHPRKLACIEEANRRFDAGWDALHRLQGGEGTRSDLETLHYLFQHWEQDAQADLHYAMECGEPEHAEARRGELAELQTANGQLRLLPWR
jgi:hypothetical protein